MSRALLLLPVFGLFTTLVCGEDPLTELRTMRDKLRARLEERIKQGETVAASQDVTLTLDRGPTGRGGFRLVLAYRGGTWLVTKTDGLPPGCTNDQVDVSGLKFEKDQLLGPVAVSWKVESENEVSEQKQTYVLDLKLTPAPRRLLVNLHRFAQGDLEMTYVPKGDGWIFQDVRSRPGCFEAWGGFDPDPTELVKGADGALKGSFILVSKNQIAERREGFNKLPKTETILGGMLSEDRIEGTWQRNGPAGKHLFGPGTDLFTAVIPVSEINGRFKADGSAGESMGVCTGLVCKAPASTVCLDAAIPGADQPAALAATWYRQILALDLALRCYPMPLLDALNRITVPTPTWTEAAGKDGLVSYMNGLVSWIRRFSDPAAKDAARIGLHSDPDPDFGPYYGTEPLTLGDGLNQVPAVGDGPQRWQHATGWRFTGPFPLVDETMPARYPEILAIPADWQRTRAFFEDKQLEFKSDTIGWLPAGQVGAVVSATEDVRASAGAMGFYVWYAACELTCAVAQEVHLAIQARGNLRIWINDLPVWDSGRDLDCLLPTVFPTALQAGVNRVLVRVATNRSSMGQASNLGWTEGWGPSRIGPELGSIRYTSFQVHLATRGRPNGPKGNPTAPEWPPADAPQGYRKDGSARFPDANPPLAWNLDKNLNVAWRLPLPGGRSEPVVRQGRLFVTAEPHLLICVDSTSGKELWRKSADVLAKDPQWGGKDAYAQFALALKQITRLESQIAEAKGDPAKVAPLKAEIGTLNATWQPFQAFLTSKKLPLPGNLAACTPVVSQDTVYAHFGTGAVAAFALDGTLKWQIDTGCPWSDVRMGSPVLADEALVLQTELPQEHGHYGLLAVEAATGKTLWKTVGDGRRVLSWVDVPGSFSNGLALMRLANGDLRKNLVITADGAVLDARTGTILHRDILPIEGNHSAPYILGDTVLFTPVLGVSATRLWLTPDGQVGARLRWNNRHGNGRGAVKNNHNNGPEHQFPGPVVADGLLYVWRMDSAHVPQHVPTPWLGLDVFDLKNGSRVKRMRGVLRDALDCTPPPIVAGKYLVACEGGAPFGGTGFGGKAGVIQTAMVETGPNPFPVAISTIPGTMRAGPVADGPRLIMRLEGELVAFACNADGQAFQAQSMAQTLFDTIPAKKEPVPVVDIQAGKEAFDAAVPVFQLMPKVMPHPWLACGPFPTAAEDPFAATGGPGQARPKPGDTLTMGGTTAAFAPLDAKFIGLDQYNFAKTLDLLGPVDRKGNTVMYYYTTVINPVTMFYKFSNSGAGITHWLAGKEIKDQDIVHLPLGRFPLLIQVQLGKLPPFVKKGMVMGPNFLKADDPMVEYCSWIELVRANRQRFELVVKDLPNTQWSGRATIYLKQLEEFDRTRK